MKLKNYLALALCVLLLVPVAISVMPQPTVAGGAGDGVDEQVKTLGKTADVVEFVADRLSEMGSGGQAYSVEDSSVPPAYTSATWHDETSLTTVVHSHVYYREPQGDNHTNQYFDMTMRMDRAMTVYLTEDASYYITEGDIFTLMETEDRINTKSSGVESLSMSFKFHIYISQERVLLKIETLDISSSSFGMTEDDLAQLAKVKNVWIDCTEERALASELQSVSQLNNGVLSAMAEYFRQHKENFTKNGEVYTLQSIYFDAFMNSITNVGFDIEDFGGEFVVDLSNTSRPVLTQVIDCSDSFYEDLSDNYSRPDYRIEYTTSMSYDSHAYEKFTFENINNTVISVPDDIKTISIRELTGEFEEEEDDG